MCATDVAKVTPGDATARLAKVSEKPANNDAGFWIRFAATAIDAIILYTSVLIASRLAVMAGVYLPFELTMVLAGVCYSVLLLAWKGRTLGKALCGVTVRAQTSEAIGFRRALARETLSKVVSTAGLFMGFIWIAISPRKRAWHDRLAGTIVVRDARVTRRARITLATVLVIVALGAGLYVHELVQAYRLVRSMASPAGAAAVYTLRAPSALTNVTGIGRDEQISIAEWIDRNGRTPMEYAVAKASEHQVVIFGEVHERREALRFLNELIPVLHHRAGVRCVAMEVCLAEDNATIERLVTDSDFDRDLARTIARHQPFALWGWKGYWNVLETVWRLNQTVSDGDEKFRVIGLDRRMDMPSVAMLGFEDNAAKDCPPWEKLRIFRALRTIPLVLVRDAFMAAQVDKEIIEKGQRGIVWVGRNHSYTGWAGPGPAGNLQRMGFLLHQRHGDRVFQIRLHGMDIPMALVDRTYEGPDPMMAEFLESVMQMRENEPVGFDVAASPLAMLRDEGSFEFHFDARLGFVDVAAGYVFLAPWRDLGTCEWLEGYISPEMFVPRRRAGVEIHDAQDANELFAHMDD
jgi:uncharacterized RDD family membrane protein YckC